VTAAFQEKLAPMQCVLVQLEVENEIPTFDISRVPMLCAPAKIGLYS